MSRFGVVELGGTKTLVAVGQGPEDIAEPISLTTTDPSQTLRSVVEALSREEVEAVGISSFGPLEMRRDSERFGHITTTPKPGWSMTDVVGAFGGLGVPVGIDTDVNGAARGEGAWGAGRGLTDFVYITVGTGVGGGAIVGRATVTGMAHPEMGHMRVVPAEGDDYPGRCPYHGACLEGMASGPALEDRFGPPETWTDYEPARRLAAHYLAQGIRNVVYALAPQRVIVGGGVSKIPAFHESIRKGLDSELNRYPPIPDYTSDDFVVPPALDNPGLVGALIVAAEAAG